MLNWDAVSTWTILVVEDERDNADVISGMLNFYGASVQQAENGQVGLDKLQTFTPTLILMDLSMPTMDGWEMLRQLKTHPAWQDIPVVVLSAHAMDGDKERALDAGFDGYVTKPIHVRTLITDLRRAMDEAAQRKLKRAAESPDPPQIEEGRPIDRPSTRKTSGCPVRPSGRRQQLLLDRILHAIPVGLADELGQFASVLRLGTQTITGAALLGFERDTLDLGVIDLDLLASFDVVELNLCHDIYSFCLCLTDSIPLTFSRE